MYTNLLRRLFSLFLNQKNHFQSIQIGILMYKHSKEDKTSNGKWKFLCFRVLFTKH